jgi:ribosomal protein L11 methyltransferase
VNQTDKQRRTWTIVEFEVTADHEDMAAWLMMHSGASGCEIKPADKEFRVLVQATFDKPKLDDGELGSLQAALEEYGLSDSLRSLRVSELEEQDWLEKWKEGFQPFTIGERFTVCPPWAEDRLTFYQKSDRHIILIEPGMAFGTGLHTTTQYCVRMIEGEPKIASALDVGTGSGILAIACALLHEESKVIALDIDPQAIKTADENCVLNKVADQIKLIVGTTNNLKSQRFPFLFSNLTCEDIIALLPEYERLLQAGGKVFCAGILEEKLTQLQTALSARHWKSLASELKNGWAGLTIQL